jgi:hypothetical protein
VTLTDLDRERIAVAVHESGHACAAVLMGASVHTSVVTRHSRSLGQAQGFTSYASNISQPALLAATFGGPWAEARFAARRHPTIYEIDAVFAGNGHSVKAALRAAAMAEGRDIEAAAARAVVPLLDRCWPAVTALARQLFFDGEVCNSDVAAALGLSPDPATRAVELAMLRAGAAPGSFTVSIPAASAVGRPRQREAVVAV